MTARGTLQPSACATVCPQLAEAYVAPTTCRPCCVIPAPPASPNVEIRSVSTQ
jgi:hypothetical protein